MQQVEKKHTPWKYFLPRCIYKKGKPLKAHEPPKFELVQTGSYPGVTMTTKTSRRRHDPLGGEILKLLEKVKAIETTIKEMKIDIRIARLRGL